MKSINSYSRVSDQKNTGDESIKLSSKGVTKRLMEKYKPKRDYLEIASIFNRKEQKLAG